MAQPVSLRGRFVRLDAAILKEKANRTDDPRHVFYRAMLSSSTYEEYFDRVGGLKVTPASYRTRPVTARAEMVYARSRMGWIADGGR